MSISHLSEPSSSALSYHLSMSQNTTAVNNDDEAYTSPSTALNQNVSLNVYANAPTAPAPSRAIICAKLSGATSFFARAVIVQNRNRIVNAEASADNAFTHIATCDASLANSEKK